MKVAYFAESPADQAALTILTEAILGLKTESAIHDGLRHRGWNAVVNVLPVVLRQLHYHRDAEGLVLVLDSDGSQPHEVEHESTTAANCRLCKLHRIAQETLTRVSPRTHLPPLKLAFGLAVPTIEAWLLCGVDPHVTEAAWANGLKERRGRMPYSKGDLKRQLYGFSHPSLSLETEVMKRAAERLSQDLTLIESLFPAGFRRPGQSAAGLVSLSSSPASTSIAARFANDRRFGPRCSLRMTEDCSEGARCKVL